VSALERYYEGTDGWIAIACTTVAHSSALLDALGIRDVDPEAALEESRDGALAERLGDALQAMSVDEVLTRLHALGAPAVPVLTLEETYSDPYLNENGFWESYRDPTAGPAVGPASSARFSRTPTGYGRAAPGLGEHSAEVLRELGVTPARIDVVLGSTS
jgi:formyl-CoA transferase